MGSFTKFVNEEDLKAEILEIVESLNEDELAEFGSYLAENLFDDVEHDDFDVEDVKAMIESLDETILPLIRGELEAIEEDVQEGVGRTMKTGNMNRQKRKFMGNTKADLRKTSASRKKKNREDKSERKRYYRANKNKIAAYQKSRSAAIKKGKHKVKLRKKA